MYFLLEVQFQLNHPQHDSKKGTHCWLKNWRSYFSCFGTMKKHLRTSRKYQLHTHASLRGTNLCNNQRNLFTFDWWTILARFTLTRLIAYLEKAFLSENQCGFHEGHGSEDMISSASQLQVKCQGHNCNLFTTFAQLTKTSGIVLREDHG